MTAALGVGIWFRLAARRNPALLAALAYTVYALLGAVALMLPVMREQSRTESVGFIDALFLSTSAVSTTGLVTLDPGSTFNFGGELILLLLIQIGGLGYMTFMSMAYIMLRAQLSPTQSRLTRSGFGLPENFRMTSFVRQVVIATLMIEAVGALVLMYQFEQAGTAGALWNGIFHSVSAFCTAGFALFPTSFEAYKDNGPMLIVLSVLSYCGAFGFVVIAECLEALVIRPRRLSITTRITVWLSAWLLAAGTAIVWIFEPAIRALPVAQQFPNALFQVMAASTTVGFNSLPIGALSSASILVLYLLMFIGASPAGTGGGLKSTTAATLAATMISSIKGRDAVSLGGYLLPQQRVIQAAGTLVIALVVILAAVTLLDLTGSYAFDKALFEVISALATVGLSMGVTGELNDAGKLIVTAVMLIGRVGILTFFVSFALVTRQEDLEIRKTRDIIL
ncbi:TrkH family potassium uptake protein [Aestuariivirga sp.]|uniref:TrkH family potassium uptake protein n=1 Tax=Aestuariivirga sp. TaxID=2650926 RepID=UPI003594219D